MLGYGSPWGPGHVEVDCIYMNRSPLLPVEMRETPLRPGVRVAAFSDAELVGGKVKAFFDRVKVRDLYDIANLKRVLDAMPDRDRSFMRRVSLFYASLSASFPHGFAQRPGRFVGRQRELEEQLLPMLRMGGGRPLLEDLVDDARGFVCSCLAPEGDEEAECLERFSSGDYRPSLLLPDEGMAAAALASPEALWKLRNLRKMG